MNIETGTDSLIIKMYKSTIQFIQVKLQRRYLVTATTAEFSLAANFVDTLIDF